MFIGKNGEGKAALLRCGCSHSWGHDDDEYTNRGLMVMGFNCYCNKCGYFGWKIAGKTDEELRRREID